MFGFEVYTYVNCPYYTNAGVKVPYNSTPGATDLKGSFAFYRPRMFRAQGSTKMYYSEARLNPQNQESLVNFRHYYIVLPKKLEAIGAIYSYDGKTTQSKDQTVPTEKRWAQVRREAEAAKGQESSGSEDSDNEELEP